MSTVKNNRCNNKKKKKKENTVQGINDGRLEKCVMTLLKVGGERVENYNERWLVYVIN